MPSVNIVDDLLGALRVRPGHPLKPALQDEFARQVEDRAEPFVQRRILQVDRQGQHLLSHAEPEGGPRGTYCVERFKGCWV